MQRARGSTTATHNDKIEIKGHMDAYERVAWDWMLDTATHRFSNG